MPIETNNLVLYKSERLTDTSDGGGKYSQVVIRCNNFSLMYLSWIEQWVVCHCVRSMLP
jgi:hypothetical protein